MKDSKKNVSKGQGKGLRKVGNFFVALLFIVSIVIAVFAGGELTANEKPDSNVVKGRMSLTSATYSTSYFVGDAFSFDKESAQILLLVKDPELNEVIKDENLPAEDYGFQINGVGDIYDDPSEVILTHEVTSVCVVSKTYPDIKVSIPVIVLEESSSAALLSECLIEAELADLYDASDNLLSYEDKCMMPDEEKPYISSQGSSPAGQDCSGGACLRNFKGGMRLEITIVSSEDIKADLTVLCCMRPSSGAFSDFFNVTFNGETLSALLGQTIPAAGTGKYFEPHTMTSVQVSLKRGVNKLVIEALGNTANLDAFRFTTEKAVLSVLEG